MRDPYGQTFNLWENKINKGIKMKEFFGALAVHAIIALALIWLILQIAG